MQSSIVRKVAINLLSRVFGRGAYKLGMPGDGREVVVSHIAQIPIAERRPAVIG